jgi:hypothetical protein
MTALKSDKIISTLEELEDRIEKRFSNSGLGKVCRELVLIAKTTSASVENVTRPHWGMRIALWSTVLAFFALIGLLAFEASALKGSDQLSDLMQGIDAAVNLIIVLGGASFFLFTFENRWKRDRALKALHEIRSIVHVIDMHQLTKDPSSDRAAMVSTGSTDQRPMSSFELMRYLDYCSEMLSLTAKCAALYAERISDSVVVDTVGDIERLTSSLSNKIWQKIAMVQSMEGRDMPLPVPSPPARGFFAAKDNT